MIDLEKCLILLGAWFVKMENWEKREINKCEELLKEKLRDVQKIGIIAYIKSFGGKENGSV